MDDAFPRHKEEVVMDSRKDFEAFRDMTPRQLWIALAAAHQALAADEVRIRYLGAEVAKNKALVEEHVAEVERLRQLIGIDPLTKALNRYLIGDALEEAVAFCRRLELPLSVLFLDIDNFKKINDDVERGGHQAGDAVLVQLVERLRETLRRYDKIGRYGGEEFIIILQGVDCENAVLVAERIRAVVAGKPFEFDVHQISVTASIGVAERQTSEMAFSLIGAADRAMLLAKRTGKNRVVSDGRL